LHKYKRDISKLITQKYIKTNYTNTNGTTS
jgi:hypothetical protein